MAQNDCLSGTGDNFMPCYRICVMDEVGTVISAVDHDCANHVAAATLAATLLPQRAQAGLWLGARLIGSISAAAGLGARGVRSGAEGLNQSEWERHHV